MKTTLDIESLLRTVQEAGKAVLSVYEGKSDYTLKEDLSPVTAADRISHELLVDGLSKLAPEVPVLSEEGEVVSYSTRKNWDNYFLIDPLDGTKEFIEKKAEFTINIALIHGGKPVLGIIHVPVNGVTYVAEAGSGAYRISQNRDRLPINSNLEKLVRVVISRREPLARLEHILSKISCSSVQRIGSSIKFCLVAEGLADFYPRLQPSMEWDTAAGTVLVQEAGGQVYGSLGKPIGYNREDLLNPPLYAVGRPLIEKIENWKEIIFSQPL